LRFGFKAQCSGCSAKRAGFDDRPEGSGHSFQGTGFYSLGFTAKDGVKVSDFWEKGSLRVWGFKI
jgi:hypothetical protein